MVLQLLFVQGGEMPPYFICLKVHLKNTMTTKNI